MNITPELGKLNNYSFNYFYWSYFKNQNFLSECDQNISFKK